MLTRLRLQNFKNFRDAEIHLGPLSLLIGANASGKSNIRDAFRFLHGISRGYTIAEVLGDKYIEGGVLQWRGIRGGVRETTFEGTDSFKLQVEFDINDPYTDLLDTIRYSIRIKLDGQGRRSRVIEESLYTLNFRIFDSHPLHLSDRQRDENLLSAIISSDAKKNIEVWGHFNSAQPILTQIVEKVDYYWKDTYVNKVESKMNIIIDGLSSMRFMDLNPNAMHMPSNPGQSVLGDQGENLSSVLQAICEDPQKKIALVEWLQELTPMDVKDLEFREDLTGKILVYLVEENGQKTSAYSASDGTLRFLAMLAAFLGPDPSKFYFFEELENGLHPVRLHLLMELIETKAAQGLIQTVATTHSPQLLRFLSADALEHASLLYRLPNSPEGRAKRIMDIPDIREILAEQDVAALHDSGWFEDAMFFSEPEESE